MVKWWTSFLYTALDESAELQFKKERQSWSRWTTNTWCSDLDSGFPSAILLLWCCDNKLIEHKWQLSNLARLQYVHTHYTVTPFNTKVPQCRCYCSNILAQLVESYRLHFPTLSWQIKVDQCDWWYFHRCGVGWGGIYMLPGWGDGMESTWIGALKGMPTWHAQGIPKTCTGHTHDMPREYPRHARDIPMTCPEHTHDMPGAYPWQCPVHTHHMPRTYPSHARGIPQHPVHAHDMPGPWHTHDNTNWRSLCPQI